MTNNISQNTDTDIQQIDPNVDVDVDTDDLDADVDDTEIEQEPTGRAAKLRARARQAETERNTATALVEALRRAEVARLADDKLAEPSDLFEYSDTTPADLIDDDGLVDPDKVAEAVVALLETRPGLAKATLRKPTPGSYQNFGQFQPTHRPTRAKASWSDIL